MSNTNDTRESPAIYVANELLQAGALVNVYDPMVTEKRILLDLQLIWESSGIDSKKSANLVKKISIHKDYKSAIKDTLSIGVLTEWEEFKKYDWNTINSTSKVFDGRNVTTNYNYSIGK